MGSGVRAGRPWPSPVVAGHEFAIQAEDFPVVEAFFGHFPQVMELHAVHQPSGREWLLARDDHLPRSPAPDSFYAFTWDGTLPIGRGRWGFSDEPGSRAGPPDDRGPHHGPPFGDGDHGGPPFGDGEHDGPFAPRSTYTLRLEVLRTLGDRDNPDHWDTWESPEFELDTGRDRGRGHGRGHGWGRGHGDGRGRGPGDGRGGDPGRADGG